MAKYLTSTNQLLEKCKAISGYACDVVYNDQLTVYSTAKMAGRDGLQRHQIILRKNDSESDYLIAWQAVFILRQFKAKKEDKANLALNNRVTSRIEKEVKTIYSEMPSEQVYAMSRRLIDGILTQLRSVPIGILVDIYLYRNYSDLRNQQEASLARQVRENWGALNIDATQFPENIVKANQLMNAAHAVMVNYQYPSAELIAPYQAVGMEKSAMKLVNLCLEGNTDTIQDKQIIDQWADILNINDWYKWVNI